MEFRVLGPLEVSHDGRVLALGGPKQRALLAILLVRANQIVSADALIDELWGERPPESATNMVQGYVSRLRKLLSNSDGDVIVQVSGGYVLRVEADRVDSHRFERLLREATRRAGERRASGGRSETARGASALAGRCRSATSRSTRSSSSSWAGWRSSVSPRLRSGSISTWRSAVTPRSWPSSRHLSPSIRFGSGCAAS